METWRLTVVRASAVYTPRLPPNSKLPIPQPLNASPAHTTLPSLLNTCQQLLNKHGHQTSPPHPLAPAEAYELTFTAHSSPAASLQKALQQVLSAACADYLLTCADAAPQRKKLLICDMDGTVVTHETLDELAELSGCGKAVAAITARAMAGELDFKEALTARVQLLRGTSLQLLEQVIEHLPFTKDARCFVQTMRAHGAHTMLASGGFKPITTAVKKALGFHEEIANTFEAADGMLTGKLLPPLVLAHSKQEALVRALKTHRLSPGDSLAVGDGANDQDMLSAAGLGVLFHGHSAVAAALNTAAAARRSNIPHIRFHSLKTLLYFQGYTGNDIKTGD